MTVMNEALIELDKITHLHKEQTRLWHEKTPEISAKGFYALVEMNHKENFLLWHEEDKARRNDQGFEYVYRAKRQIDQHNQRRNDAMEAMDEWIVEHYQPKQNHCPYHSETPGMMIDRLSILSLKEYHMKKQLIREDVSNDHRASCEKKYDIICLQCQHLKENLDHFLTEIKAGTRSFRIYHQFKMYNDPNLNPQLYLSKQDAND